MVQVIFRVNAPVKIPEVAEVAPTLEEEKMFSLSAVRVCCKLELPLHLKKADFAGGRK